MTKNNMDSQDKTLYEYPDVNIISQGISKKLETELQDLVTRYHGGEGFPLDLVHGNSYLNAVEGRLSRIIQDFVIDMTKDWSKDKLNQYNESLRGKYMVHLSRELIKDLENVTKIDFGYYKDFGKQIPYLIIPQMIDGVEKVLESKISNEATKPAKTAKEGIATKISRVLNRKAA